VAYVPLLIGSNNDHSCNALPGAKRILFFLSVHYTYMDGII